MAVCWGLQRPFLAELCDTVIRENGGAYPELVEHADYIKKTISAEEERFSRTIDQGLNILSNLIDNIEKAAAEGKRRVLAGIDAFKLNDTFGFPLDLTKEIAAENGIEVDEDSFRTEMQKQREKARKDRQSRGDISGWTAICRRAGRFGHRISGLRHAGRLRPKSWRCPTAMS